MYLLIILQRQQVYSVVKVELSLKGSPPICLSLYVVPVICKPLVRQPISACANENQHLATLDLADYSDGSLCLEVDLLIGSDFYWGLVTGGVRRGSKGPLAMHTFCQVRHPQEGELGHHTHPQSR